MGEMDNQKDKVWMMHLLSSLITLGTVISRIHCIPFNIPLYFTSLLTVQGYDYVHTKQAQWNLRGWLRFAQTIFWQLP